MKSKELNQFYTNPLVSDECVEIVNSVIKKINYKDFIFLEPAAGTGNFIRSIQKCYKTKKVVAIDIDPKDYTVSEMDFFKSTHRKLKIKKKEKVIVIGNPPFGKRSKLAIDFVNKACEYADVIAFIVPLQFEKWSVQSKINKDLKLIYSDKLNPKSFILNDKDYSVRCCFQIWVKNDIEYFEDKRIKETPKTTHPDFEMFLYNNTRGAEKFLNKKLYNWDFGVPRQGYYDYSFKIYDEEDINPRIQWIFFKTKNKTILNRLKKLDYNKLSLKNTMIPGFGKADIIEEYERIYGD